MNETEKLKLLEELRPSGKDGSEEVEKHVPLTGLIVIRQFLEERNGGKISSSCSKDFRAVS